MSIKEVIVSARDKLKTEDWVTFNRKLLEQKQKDYDGGDNFALLEAVEICALSDIKLPEWAADGYIETFQKIKQLDIRSLDDAFNFHLPKGKHIDSHKSRKRLNLPVFVACLEANKDGLPLTRKSRKESAFDLVGRQFNISAGLAEKIYQEVKLMLGLQGQDLNTTKK
jgi:hypothetical protein